MSSSMMRTDLTAMGMTASGRDFADLDAAGKESESENQSPRRLGALNVFSISNE